MNAGPASKPKRNNRNGKKKAERADAASTAVGSDVKQSEGETPAGAVPATDDKQRARVPITAMRGRGGKQPRPQTARVQPVDSGAVAGQPSDEAKLQEGETTTAASAAPKRERTSRLRRLQQVAQNSHATAPPASPGAAATQPAAPKYKPVVKADANAAAVPPPTAQPSAAVV